MNEKLTKFRFFLDYEKEEDWVNDMSKQGWHLISFNFNYFTFEKGEPGQYIYRNEMLSGLGAKDQSKEYIEFLQQSGVELVQRRFNWAYFRKNTSDGPFELYTDTSSKITYLNRIYTLFLFLMLVNLLSALTNLTGLFDYQIILGSCNLTVAILLFIPFVKVKKRRDHLKKNLDLFND
ncbi:uncharacterized protein DUF2812 [Ureibacillus xyleni]|uniref:Uncharacterized protein DUF2812 n=1 Tax=Ureibacillus xyleni TaxID=614648 RepID=A0A285SE63_9BACL|nr:DUF2812 domain-containing protein [Ureibacillus xyleni]SOC06150.1 uncharacterized protein DUF2812 [Ureibacillus xyleni]